MPKIKLPKIKGPTIDTRGIKAKPGTTNPKIKGKKVILPKFAEKDLPHSAK